MEFPNEKKGPEEKEISFRDLQAIPKKPVHPTVRWPIEAGHEEAATTDSPEPLYNQAIVTFEQVVKGLLEGRRPDLSPPIRIATDFVGPLSTSSRLLFLSLSYAETPFYPLLNAVNSTLLAIKVGMGVGYAKEDLIKLGVASLLHNVGMWKIPREVLLKPGPLSASERMEIKKCPLYSKELLKTLPPGYEWLATVAEQTHERETGSGYPNGLKGQEIHEFAKIIGLVDAYEAMTRYRPYRAGGFRTPDEAIKELLHCREAEGYSEDLIKTLLRQLSVYPPGSFVRLNSGEIARVLEINPLAPLRPRVEVLFDPGLKRLKTPKVLDLDQDLLLYITGCLLPTALPKEV